MSTTLRIAAFSMALALGTLAGVASEAKADPGKGGSNRGHNSHNNNVHFKKGNFGGHNGPGFGHKFHHNFGPGFNHHRHFGPGFVPFGHFPHGHKGHFCDHHCRFFVGHRHHHHH